MSEELLAYQKLQTVAGELLSSETESIGVVLCKLKNREEVRFALAGTTSPLKVATYKTQLPPTQMILKRLGQLTRRKEME